MDENYSVEEILNAVDDLQNFKRDKKLNQILANKKNIINKSDIPSNTLLLIEEAEKSIKLKLRSE